MSVPLVDSLKLAMSEPCTAARCERFLRKFKTSLDSLRDKTGSHYESNSNGDVELIEAIESDTESDDSSLNTFDDVSLGVLISTSPSRQKEVLIPTSPSRPCWPTARHGSKRVSLPISLHNSISLLHCATTLSLMYHMLAS